MFLEKLIVTQLVKKFPAFYVSKASLLYPQEPINSKGLCNIS
jgi:hypothetical protein